MPTARKRPTAAAKGRRPPPRAGGAWKNQKKPGARGITVKQLQTVTAEECRRWRGNDMVNPRTGNPFKSRGGEKYKTLLHACGRPMKTA